MKKLKLCITVSVLLLTIILLGSCDKCKDTNCQNDGICHDGKCTCLYGYEGDHCETIIREKMTGKYQGRYTCADSNNINGYLVQIKPHPDERAINKISVIANGGPGETFCEVTGSNTFALEYTAGGGKISFSMKGEVKGDSLIYRLITTNEGYPGNNCTFRGVRN